MQSFLLVKAENSTEWKTEEKIRLLELFVDKDSGLWEDRANTLQREFQMNRPANFFTISSVRSELNKIFAKPNPEHHISGLPSHPRGKEAAELWLKHFRNEQQREKELRKQMYTVALRKQLDLIRRHQQGKLPKEELDAILLEARERDAKRTDKEEHETMLKRQMEKIHLSDVKNVRTFSDYLRFLGGDRIPPPPKSPSPVKVPEVASSPEKATNERMESPFKEIQNGMGEKMDTTNQEANKEVENNEGTTLDISLSRSEEDLEVRTNWVFDESESAELRTHEAKYEEISVYFGKAITESKLSITHTTYIRNDEFIGNEIQLIVVDDAKELERKRLEPNKSNAKKASPAQPKELTTPVKQRVLRTQTLPTTARAQSPRKRKSTESGEVEDASPSKTPRRQTRQRSEVTLEVDKPSTSSKLHTPSISPKTVSSFSSATSHDETQKSTESPKLRSSTRRQSQQSSKIAEPNEPGMATRLRSRASASVDDDQVQLVKKEEQPVNKPASPSPVQIVATPPPSSSQLLAITPSPLLSGVAATAKLRSSLRRAAIASATPSPAVDSVGDNGLFLKPGKHSSTETIPKQTLLTLWKDILSHRYSAVFSNPVSEHLVHGYHSAIKKPMDLKTLKQKIESGAIQNFGQFSHAILQMFANAVMYNSTGHYVNSNAKEMLAYSLKCIETVQFPGGQFHVPISSRHSNGSSSESGKIPWATVSKNMIQKQLGVLLDESNSTSQKQEEQEDDEEEEPVRRLFIRRPPQNRRYIIGQWQ